MNKLSHFFTSDYEMGDVVSTATRCSTQAKYEAAVSEYFEHNPNPGGFKPHVPYYSIELVNKTERLFINTEYMRNSKGVKYISDCTIEYLYVPIDSDDDGLFTSFYNLLTKLGLTGVEAPGDSLQVGSDKKITVRAVLQSGGYYRGVIINPPYPFVEKRRSGYEKVLALLMVGVAVGVSWGPVSQWLNSRRR